MLVARSHLREEDVAAAQRLSSLSGRSVLLSRGGANEAGGEGCVVMLDLMIFAIYYLKE